VPQKEWRLSVATNMLQEAESDENFMGQIIMGDETWVYEHDPEKKHQSSQWKSAYSPRPKKVCQVRSKVKVMLIVFFDMEDIVHYEYVPQGQTVNQQFYLQVLKRLRLAVSRKKPQKGAAGAWALHHNNAPAYTAHSIQVFLATNGIPFVQQPPYCPDMAQHDFWLFRQLKRVMKGERFEDTEAIKKNPTITLNTIPKDCLKNVSSSCRTAGNSVLAHKESILKIIKYF
jgi:transposase